MSLRWQTLAAAWMLGLSALSAQSSSPALRVIRPTPDSYLTGSVELAAAVTPPGTEVSDVTFFVDGRQVCRLVVPPFSCMWDAGPRPASREIRVVATLKSNQSLVRKFRTAGLDISQAVAVEAVLVSVHVTDDRGRFVEGLSKSQFRILEDGVPQEITSFLDQDAPASVLLQLDASGSMAPAVEELKAASTRFLGSLRPLDRVILTSFNAAFSVLAPATSATEINPGVFNNLRPSGQTALYDAMIRSAELLKAQAGPRALVVFTDGDDDASITTLEDVRATLQSIDVVLYFIAQGRAERDQVLQAALRRVARETGGDAYFSAQMSALHSHFATIVSDLRHQYVLGYTPLRELGDGGWRKISVQVDEQGRRLTVRSRQGYLATHRGG